MHDNPIETGEPNGVRSSEKLDDENEKWDCKCGYSNVPHWMDFCSSCWANRITGDRQWARIRFMDFRPGGEVLKSSNKK